MRLTIATIIIFFMSVGNKIELQDIVIITDGNSLTFGYGVSTSLNYPSQLEDSLSGYNATVNNKAVNGQQTQAMIDDYDTDIAPYYTDTVSCILMAWEIGNDLYNNADLESAQNRFKQYCLLGKATGFTVGVINLAPRNAYGVYVSREAYNQDLTAANQWLETNYTNFSDFFVNILEDSIFVDFDQTYYNADSTHFTALGYRYIATKVKEKLIEISQ